MGENFARKLLARGPSNVDHNKNAFLKRGGSCMQSIYLKKCVFLGLRRNNQLLAPDLLKMADRNKNGGR